MERVECFCAGSFVAWLLTPPLPCHLGERRYSVFCHRCYVCDGVLGAVGGDGGGVCRALCHASGPGEAGERGSAGSGGSAVQQPRLPRQHCIVPIAAWESSYALRVNWHQLYAWWLICTVQKIGPLHRLMMGRAALWSYVTAA